MDGCYVNILIYSCDCRGDYFVNWLIISQVDNPSDEREKAYPPRICKNLPGTT